MTAVFFHPEADAEVVAAAAYYEGQQEDLGKRFLSSVGDGLARIRINPRLCPLIDDDVRRCLTRTFPFGILFRDRGGRIEIIAVMHLRRTPGYWKERV
ncbi:MAG: plasmid stabilization system [Geobacteraceae bacterium]|nr:MAG: plasmid stabilization system [Geobacteraceae bacterium]